MGSIYQRNVQIVRKNFVFKMLIAFLLYHDHSTNMPSGNGCRAQMKRERNAKAAGGVSVLISSTNSCQTSSSGGTTCRVFATQEAFCWRHSFSFSVSHAIISSTSCYVDC